MGSNGTCGCLRGVCDETRRVCTCPLGFDGARCEVAQLPACMLADHPLPIRSWLLHAFHDGAAAARWPAHRSLGPVPCECIVQLLAAPFLLERSRLQHMRAFRPSCLLLPPHVSLAALLAEPSAATWRRFSFAAAHDALRVGAEPSLHGAPFDAARPRLGRLIRQLRKAARRKASLAGLPTDLLHPTIAAVASAEAPALPLLPLSRCPGGCGGLGWCEAASPSAARCGCFVPGGLAVGVGGRACGDAAVWEAARQPEPHWGPRCLRGCSGRGRCDWQGFCLCERGVWGVDCSLGWAGGGAAVLPRRAAPPPLEEWRSAEMEARPLSPPTALLAREARLRASPRAWRRRRRAARRPLLYVVDMPPHLRFGVDFADGVERRLTERVLGSSHRAASVAAADFLWVPGAPLVIDGQRLLARLWHLWAHWLPAAPPPDGRRLALLPLLTERGSMDSLQLSYSDVDREEWPQLKAAPHVKGLLRLSPGCATAPILPPSAPSASPADGWGLDGVAEDLLEAEALERELEAALWRRRAREGAPMLAAFFRSGGYAVDKARRAGCALPPEFDPSSASRFWAGLQFNGNPGAPVFFRRGHDVVIPQLLLLERGGSHADQPSCEQMAATSPFSPSFRLAQLHANRSRLLFFAGHPGHGDARTRLFRLHSGRPGFELFDSLRNKQQVSAINMSLTSLFCFVPRGQGQGDPTRHMVSLFHGCIPTFTLGPSHADDALPFDEVLDWTRFSLRVPLDELQHLPERLWSVAADAPRLRSMQAELACVWRRLFWSSLVGSCFGEPMAGDAFDTLMLVLRRRLLPLSLRQHLDPTRATRRECDPSSLLKHLRSKQRGSGGFGNVSFLSPGAGPALPRRPSPVA
ncbi:hypothetical protein AB1Y20_001484 [Prymnesium parvum]|uniref:EGF-like domain-containing protein n=1 Tax=Prymnesium parvum TaxID=97485 RepID=A0AB34K9P3_PRYPA